MSLLLKIVRGPNAGAEIALVDGVGVTLGKTDDCDIVLADQTLGDAPMRIEVAAGGATLDGARLEPLHVVTRGSTSFAVGPSDSAWGELVWKEVEEGSRGAAETPGESPEGSAVGDGGAPGTEGEPRGPASPREEKRRPGCLGCLLWLLVLLLILLGLAWLFRGALRPKAEELWGRVAERCGAGASRNADGRAQAPDAPEQDMSSIVEKYALSVTNRNGREVFVGDFKTRADRLAATAEAYAAKPGVNIDFADNESLKTAVADTLALVGETRLSVSIVTSRVAVIRGVAVDIRQAVEAIAADVPKIENVDLSGVVIAHESVPAPAPAPAPAPPAPAAVAKPAPARPAEILKPIVKTAAIAKASKGAVRLAKPRAAAPLPSLPVCGILSTPYPCLVLNDGKRILEGASIGDWTVLKIDVDSVVITNAMGRFVWKP